MIGDADFQEWMRKVRQGDEQAAAWLVRANAYTQSALGDVIRLRAVTLANSGAQLKFNAANGAQIRQNTLDSLK